MDPELAREPDPDLCGSDGPHLAEPQSASHVPILFRLGHGARRDQTTAFAGYAEIQALNAQGPADGHLHRRARRGEAHRLAKAHWRIGDESRPTGLVWRAGVQEEG